MEIHSASPGLYYAVFFILSIAVASAIQFVEGRRLGFPVISWIVVILLSRFFFLSGIQLITYSFADWKEIFHTFSLPVTHARSVLGGFIGFAGAYLFIRFYLKYDNRFLDTLPSALLVGMAIQRIGCLMVGCCGGTACTMPWAIHYSAGSLPYEVQQSAGLISHGASHSLNMHPIALYYIVACIVIFILHRRFISSWKAKGNSLLFVGICFLIVRFIIEFFIDTRLETVGTNYVGGLKMVQWGSLAVALLFSVLVFYRERKALNVEQCNYVPTEMPLRNLILAFLMLNIFWMCRNFFSGIEFLILGLIFVALFVAVSVRVFINTTVQKYRWVPVALGFAFVILSSQKSDNPADTVWKKSTYISLGHVEGEYETEYKSGCTHEQYRHQSQVSSIQISKQREKINEPDKMKEYGLGLIIGDDNIRQISADPSKMGKKSINIFGINPYYNYNSHLFGIGAGIGVGNFTFGNQPKDLAIMPQMFFRAGPKNMYYIECDVLYGNPLGSQMPQTSLKIGTGFGLLNATDFNFGIAAMGKEGVSFFTFEATVPLYKRLYIMPNFGYYNSINYFGALTLKYRIY